MAVQQPSFRGVPFDITGDEESGGRRVVSHEFPGRNESYPEDLGGASKMFSFPAFMVGSDVDDRRRRLIEALEKAGPGELVHPTYGVVQVQAHGYSCSTSITTRRMVTFRLTFERIGPAVTASPLVAVDTQARAVEAVQAVQVATSDTFYEEFDIAGLPDWAVKIAGDPMAAASDLLQDLAGTVDLGDVLGDLGDGLSAAQSLNPVAAFQDAFAQVRAAVPVDIFDGIAGQFSSLIAPGASLQTPSRIKAALGGFNAAAMVRRVALSERVLGGLAREFGNSDAAIALRNELSGLLNVEAIAAADAGQDIVADRLFDLRGRTVIDLSDRAANLPWLTEFEVPDGPVLEIANRLYGDGTRAAELLAQAPVRHPLFHPGTGIAVSR